VIYPAETVDLADTGRSEGMIPTHAVLNYRLCFLEFSATRGWSCRARWNVPRSRGISLSEARAESTVGRIILYVKSPPGRLFLSQ
jgi:hypothetical protein